MLSKRTKTKLFSGAFLLALIFAAFYGAYSGQSNYNQRRQSADAQATDETKDVSVNERIADYNLWLTILTGALAFVSICQLHFLNRSDKTARMAAKAATKTVDQFRDKERARFIASDTYGAVIVKHPPEPDPPDATVVRRKILVRTRFYNCGATPGLIGKMRIKLVVARKLPERVSLLDGPCQLAYYQVPIMPGEHGSYIEFMEQIDLPREEAIELHRPQTDASLKIFIVGSIVFKDIFGVIRTFVFASKSTGASAVPTKGESYNREYEPYYEPEGDRP